MSATKTAADMQSKIDEAKALLQPIKGEPAGSELSDIIDKFVAWVDSLNLGDYSWDAVHMLFHFAVEVFVPQLIALFPSSLQDLAKKVILPLLAKIDQYLFDHAVPVS